MTFRAKTLIAASLVFISTNAFAVPVSTNGLVSLRYQTGENLTILDPQVKYPDAGFAAAYLMPGLEVNQGGLVSGTLELYTGELSPRTFASDSLDLYGVENVNDYFNDTYFVRQAYADFKPVESIHIDAGQQAVVGGSRLLFYNYQPAITFDFNMIDSMDVPLSLALKVVKVEPYKLYDPARTSMFYDAELSYSFSLFEYVKVFYANFQDTDNTLVPVLNDAVFYSFYNRNAYNELVSKYGRARADMIIAALERSYNAGGPVHTSTSSINWMGITGDRYFGMFEINFTGILETGDSTISGNNVFQSSGTFTRHFNTYGYLADAKLKYHVGGKAVFGLFFNLSSGDKTPLEAVVTQGTLNSFISVFPYNTESTLFFQGGINQNLNAGSMEFAGRRGLGVEAYGGIIDVYPIRSIELTVTPLLIYPEMTDNAYGFETDATCTYLLNRYVSFPFEWDWFAPGNYFNSLNLSNVYQVLFGADVQW